MLAWEINDEDVQKVVEAHGVVAGLDSEKLTGLVGIVWAEGARIQNAVNFSDDMDIQTEIALAEIEDILMEQGCVSGEKLFNYAQ